MLGHSNTKRTIVGVFLIFISHVLISIIVKNQRKTITLIQFGSNIFFWILNDLNFFIGFYHYFKYMRQYIAYRYS